jgi:hypothetical protein
MTVIDRLLDEAEKAQRKGHLLLAEVCRDAADELGLVIEERNRLQETMDKIARADFNCTSRQMGMAMQGCAEDAIPQMPVDRVGDGT